MSLSSAVAPVNRWTRAVASAAIMHGFWDAFVGFGVVMQLVLGVIFYALLIAAVLKARQISPTRGQNFATVLVGSPMVAATPVPAHAAVAAPSPQAPPPPVPPPRVEPPLVQQPQVRPDLAMRPPAAASGLKLHIGLRTLPLHDGARFQANEIAGLHPASEDGYVAVVNHNPQDPSVLGLQNLSTNPWIAVLPGSEVREVPMGKSVKLASGSRIDFGTSQGEVQ
jgi:hypothetical protein